MKCPHCEYEHGWSGEKLDVVEGEDGGFFELSNRIVACRNEVGYGDGEETRPVYACPCCRKVFIGD